MEHQLAYLYVLLVTCIHGGVMHQGERNSPMEGSYVFLAYDRKVFLLPRHTIAKEIPIGQPRNIIVLHGVVAGSGEFIPQFGRKTGHTRSVRFGDKPGEDGEYFYNAPANGEAYELRSRRLIPGKIDNPGHFKPDLGGVITDFKDYQYTPKKSRVIYNLPGEFIYMILPAKDKAKKGTLPSDADSKPPSAATAMVPGTTATVPWGVATVVMPEPPTQQDKYLQYQIVSDLKRNYFLVCRDKVWTGRLDEYGDFVYSTESYPVGQIGLLIWQGYFPLMRSPNDKEVYEYRSGRLIPGRIEQGLFVPDLGGKVIDFATYTPRPPHRPIYNLPGYFKAQGVNISRN